VTQAIVPWRDAALTSQLAQRGATLSAWIVRWSPLELAQRWLGIDVIALDAMLHRIRTDVGDVTMVEDLRCVVDELWADPKIAEVVEAIAKETAQERRLRRLGWIANRLPMRWGLQDDEALTLLRAGFRFARELERILPTVDERVFTYDLYDQDVPAEIKSLMLAVMRAPISFFALIFTARTSPQWSRELATMYRDGIRATLVLAATMPGVQVRERVLARSERLDLGDVYERHRRTVDSLRKLPLIKELKFHGEA
jgi:hypothetical protein